MAKTYLGVLPIGTALFTIEKKKKNVGRKTGFPCPETSPVGGVFPSYFPTDFVVKPSVPGGNLKASLFLLLAQAGASQLCAHEKKGVPQNGEILFGAYFKGMNKKNPQ